jgi:histone H2B
VTSKIQSNQTKEVSSAFLTFNFSKLNFDTECISIYIGRKKKVTMSGDENSSAIPVNIDPSATGEQKGAVAAAKNKKKKLTVRDPAAFQLYIFRVMRQIKPELAISKKAIAQINQIIGD